jgi:hypothetical protein
MGQDLVVREVRSQAIQQSELIFRMTAIGWQSQYVPWTGKARWEEIVEIIGEENIKIVAMIWSIKARRQLCRGNILISPEGIRRAFNNYTSRNS